jgi:methylenetetrahydrofolate--tRNA-(uracil-5-)-methyltransferase
VEVTIHEMRPVRKTAVHKTDGLAELVCSNSFRGDKLDNAVGLLKEEMRRLGSIVMRAADAARVPAGAALAVDRDVFSQRVTEAISRTPASRSSREEVPRVPGQRVVAGHHRHRPAHLRCAVRRHAALVGDEHLSFYDAISPIVLAESIDRSKVFRVALGPQSSRRRAAPRPTVRRAGFGAAPDAGLRGRLPELPA